MYSFIGLGNPGNQYADTKHNAGFWVIDELCKRWNINLLPGDDEYVFCLLYTSPSPRDQRGSRIPSCA